MFDNPMYGVRIALINIKTKFCKNASGYWGSFNTMPSQQKQVNSLQKYFDIFGCEKSTGKFHFFYKSLSPVSVRADFRNLKKGNFAPKTHG